MRLRILILALIFSFSASSLVAQDITTPYQFGFYHRNHGVFLMNADGTNLTRLSVRNVCGHFSFDPTGNKIALVDGDFNDVVVVDLLTGEEEVILNAIMPDSSDPQPEDDPAYCHAFWSPDGSTLLIGESDASHIYSIPPDGGELTGLLEDVSSTGFRLFGWSPDGTRFGFTGRLNEDTASSIYTVGITENDIIKVSEGLNATFSPDGMHILFRAPHRDDSYAVFKVLADGSTAPELMFEQERLGATPYQSPDGDYALYTESTDNGQQVVLKLFDDNSVVMQTEGRGAKSYVAWRPVPGELDLSNVGMNPGPQIVFERYEGPESEINGVYMIDAFTLEETLISRRVPCGDMNFSPDGSTLALVELSSRELVLIDMETQNETVLLDSTQLDAIPCYVSWNQTGDLLLYADGPEVGSQGIYQVAVDGNSDAVLVYDGEFDDSAPQWEPGGSRFVFHSDAEQNNYRIWVGDTETGIAERVSDVPFASFFDFDVNPDWRPNSDEIIFHQDNGFQTDLYMQNIDGSDRTNITRSSELNEFAPRFSPDGTQIVYHLCESGDPPNPGVSCELVISDVDGTNTRPLTGNLVREWIAVWRP